MNATQRAVLWQLLRIYRMCSESKTDEQFLLIESYINELLQGKTE